MTAAWYSPRSVAARWDVKKPTVLRYIRSGQLEARRLAVGVSRRVEFRVSKEAIEKFEDKYFVPVVTDDAGAL